MNIFDIFKKKTNDGVDRSEAGRQTALHDGTPVTIILKMKMSEKIFVKNDLTGEQETVTQEDLAEPQSPPSKKSRFW
jgi:hypothetical protein